MCLDVRSRPIPFHCLHDSPRAVFFPVLGVPLLCISLRRPPFLQGFPVPLPFLLVWLATFGGLQFVLTWLPLSAVSTVNHARFVRPWSSDPYDVASPPRVRSGASIFFFHACHLHIAPHPSHPGVICPFFFCPSAGYLVTRFW